MFTTPHSWVCPQRNCRRYYRTWNAKLKAFGWTSTRPRWGADWDHDLAVVPNPAGVEIIKINQPTNGWGGCSPGNHEGTHFVALKVLRRNSCRFETCNCWSPCFAKELMTKVGKRKLRVLQRLIGVFTTPACLDMSTQCSQFRTWNFTSSMWLTAAHFGLIYHIHTKSHQVFDNCETCQSFHRTFQTTRACPTWPCVFVNLLSLNRVARGIQIRSNQIRQTCQKFVFWWNLITCASVARVQKRASQWNGLTLRFQEGNWLRRLC